MRALASLAAGRSVRGVAEDLYGAAEVAAQWHSDGGMRSKTRRRIDKARALMTHGYREIAAGTAPRRSRSRRA